MNCGSAADKSGLRFQCALDRILGDQIVLNARSKVSGLGCPAEKPTPQFSVVQRTPCFEEILVNDNLTKGVTACCRKDPLHQIDLVTVVQFVAALPLQKLAKYSDHRGPSLSSNLSDIGSIQTVKTKPDVISKHLSRDS